MLEGTLILFEQFGDSKRWYGKQHSNELELILFWKIAAHAFSQKKKNFIYAVLPTVVSVLIVATEQTHKGQRHSYQYIHFTRVF